MSKNSSLLISLIICFYAVILMSCVKNKQGNSIAVKNKIEIELEFSFPEESSEEDRYFWSAWHLECDTSGNIYVSDKRLHSVMVFSPKGFLLDTIGEKGQGPGQLEKPAEIIVDDDFIVVKDVSRIQFF